VRLKRRVRKIGRRELYLSPLNGLDAQKPLRVAFPWRREQLRDPRIHIIHQDNVALGRSEEEMHKCSFRRWFYGDCEKILGRIRESLLIRRV